jgi:hydrogenase/urease accessory protein HupE
VNPPADDAAADEHPTAPSDVPTARLLVAAQFVLIGILVVLPGRQDWPVPAALTSHAASLPSSVWA